MHRRFNRSTAPMWNEYADHRNRVMSLIGRQRSGSKNLVVLGAGNCNDIHLVSLTKQFDEVHLVDMDQTAMANALARASLETSQRLRLHRFDLSGTLGHLAKWTHTPPTAAELRGCTDEAIASSRTKLPGPFDVVLSSLVLSQIVHTATDVLAAQPEVMPRASLVGVVTHLRIALELLAEGGSLVLAIDTLARPVQVMHDWLAHSTPDRLLVEADARKKCLPGTEVSFVTSLIQQFRPSARIELTEAWLWQPSPKRSHLVYGLVAR